MLNTHKLSKLGFPSSEARKRASRAYWYTSHPFKAWKLDSFVIFDILRPEVEYARAKLSYNEDSKGNWADFN